MLQKSRKKKLEDGHRIDAQGVIYREDGDQKILVKVDEHSPMRQNSGWGVDSYIIEPGTTRIEDDAFNFCDALKKVMIPDTVRTIGEYAFANCQNLEEVCFQQSAKLEYLPEHVFQQCNKLHQIVIPDSVRYISDYAFSFCKGLRMVVLPDNIGFDKPADYTPGGTSDLMEMMGLGFKLLQHSIESLECVKIPEAKSTLLEEKLPHLKHLFVNK